MYRKLLVACDGSEGSQIAVLHASILAKKLGAELSALWVRGSLPHYPETIDEIDVEEESAYEFFENIKAQLQSVGAGQGVTIRPEMRTGHPAQQILEFARAHDTDLIVLGSRGHSRLWGRTHWPHGRSRQRTCAMQCSHRAFRTGGRVLSQNTCRLRRLGCRGHSAPTRPRAGKAHRL